jgi:hypothetical protein
MRIGYDSFFLLAGFIALAFLVYTLLNLEKLGIDITHPRVIVELFLFILFLIISLYLKGQ